MLLGPISYFTLRHPEETAASWWDDDWGYRKAVTVSNSGSAQTDYQVDVDVDTAALITANKMQSDCSDIVVVGTDTYHHGGVDRP